MTVEGIWIPRNLLMEFDGLMIGYDHRVRAPRSWTVAQSSWAAELAQDAPPGPMLELCSGAGQIGLAAITHSARHLVCVDVDPAAVQWCRHNAYTAGLRDRVTVREGRLETVLGDDEQFAVILADPPRVRGDDAARLADLPLLAIDGGLDGTDVALACLSAIERHLAPGGVAILQLSTVGQLDVIASAAEDRGLVRLVDVREIAELGVLARFDAEASP